MYLHPVNFDLQQYTQNINSTAETVNILIPKKVSVFAADELIY